MKSGLQNVDVFEGLSKQEASGYVETINLFIEENGFDPKSKFVFIPDHADPKDVDKWVKSIQVPRAMLKMKDPDDGKFLGAVVIETAKSKAD